MAQKKTQAPCHHLRKRRLEPAYLMRKPLTERKITLEDRPDGTLWRAE